VTVSLGLNYIPVPVTYGISRDGMESTDSRSVETTSSMEILFCSSKNWGCRSSRNGQRILREFDLCTRSARLAVVRRGQLFFPRVARCDVTDRWHHGQPQNLMLVESVTYNFRSQTTHFPPQHPPNQGWCDLKWWGNRTYFDPVCDIGTVLSSWAFVVYCSLSTKRLSL